MGKWSGDYYDDILTTKIKSLVSGAIVRSKLERGEDGVAPPTITYEKFVEELSSGDAFATTLIDALVGELADRRKRPADEREYVSYNTAKTLRSLSNRALREQGPSTSHPRRRTSAWRSASRNVLHPPPDSAFEPEAEDFETMGDGPASTSLENVRSLHDAYSTWVGSSGLLMPRSRESVSPPLPAFLTDEPILSLPSPPRRTDISVPMPVSSYPPPQSGASLLRTASLRRPTRSRTMDFNDFSNQRRAQYRARTQSEALAHEAADIVEAAELGGSSTSRSRRFFPTRHHHHRHMHSDGEPLPWLPAEEMDQRSDFDTPPPVEPHAFSSLFTAGETGDIDSRERALIFGPSTRRLRRGGVRAPEYMAARRDPNIPRMLPSPSTSSENDARHLGGAESSTASQNDGGFNTVEIISGDADQGLPTPPLFVTEDSRAQ